MTDQVKVWTKQNSKILDDLEKHGRYIVKKRYITEKMAEHAALYLDVYTWYMDKAKKIAPIPRDVQYPIWVSLAEEEKIENSDGNVLLELMTDKDTLITMDMDKWGMIVNYLYIPQDSADAQRHEKLLTAYGVDDCQAYLSPFYPSIRTEIIRSRDRLFDDSIILSQMKVGTIWEIKAEWIVKIHHNFSDHATSNSIA